MNPGFRLLEYSLRVREQSSFGGILTHGRITAPCSLGTIGYGGRLTSGGISAHAEITVVVRKEVMPGPFKVGERMTLRDANGKEMQMKIASEGITDGCFFTELVLTAAAEGVK